MQQPFGMNGAWQQHGGPWQNQQQYQLPPTPQPQDGIVSLRRAVRVRAAFRKSGRKADGSDNLPFSLRYACSPPSA